MGTEIYLAAVIFLMLCAVFDLMVGVSNDAVNFLNSSIGSRVAPYFVIMIIASLGILAGVTFSSGMMEVARKGIFHPQFFTMPELITIFMAVMLTDILLLDLFNTYGLPTSTTVSIVFELLGAAVAMSVIKIIQSPEGLLALGDYINTSKAMSIIFGILLSIIVAFICGAVVQFVTRIIFTFDYQKKMKRYGALWGGVAMAAITFFILVKGAKGASFMTAENVAWISDHSLLILFFIFAVTAVVFQILITVFKINTFKPVVLVGTFALAMAFAANDLVNFIGVPLAGLGAFKSALASADPLNAPMSALAGKVQSQTFILLLAGVIMVITLWLSRKAKTVTETEIRLGQQDEGIERFESIWLSRVIVHMGDSVLSAVTRIFPGFLRRAVSCRIDPEGCSLDRVRDKKPSFDLVRASVNLMVASMVVSFATSLKLPLSTTYVTFMVAMGTSFSDQAWGRESAVYRITGVLTVVSGWFMTAFIAFAVSSAFVAVIYFLKVLGVILLIGLAGMSIWKNHRKHHVRVEAERESQIFVLHRVTDAREALSKTFNHLALLLGEINSSLEITLDALFREDMDQLSRQRKKVKQIQLWSNIITANIFKALRVVHKNDDQISSSYAQIIRRLQRLSDGHRDIVLRSFMHVANKHKGLLPEQVRELKLISTYTSKILSRTETILQSGEIGDHQELADMLKTMREIEMDLNRKQVDRITNDASKTRLSILFYAIVGNNILVAKQNIKLLNIFNKSFAIDRTL